MSATAPLVSVIMPVFNGEHFVPRAFDSLCAQSYERWELVVVDDGSTDGTPDFFTRMDDQRVRYHRFENNRGLGAALNVGLDDAHGEYIAYLPCDDVVYRDHLASLVSCLQGQRDALFQPRTP